MKRIRATQGNPQLPMRIPGVTGVPMGPKPYHKNLGQGGPAALTRIAKQKADLRIRPTGYNDAAAFREEYS